MKAIVFPSNLIVHIAMAYHVIMIYQKISGLDTVFANGATYII